ncbi:MAG: WD40 repeat domain-containing protein, partial [Acidimicrobiales bacterium]
GSTIRLCSLFTESCRAWLPAGLAQVVGLDGSGPQHLGAAVLASGRLLAGSLDDTPREIEGVSDGRVVALHPEQPLLAVGHRSGSVTVGSPSGPFETIGRFPSEVVSVGFDPGTRWVAATDGRTVSLLPIGSFNGFDSLWEGNVSTVSFSADGSWLLVGDENTGDLLAFDLAGGGSIDSGQVDTRPRRLAGHRSAPTVIAVGPDAVVTGSLDGDVRMWSLGRFVQVGPSFVAEPAGQGVTLVDRFRTTAVGLSPDRLRLFVFRQDGVVVTWDTGGRSALARRSSPLPGPAVDVAGFGGGDVVALLADGTVVRHDGEGVEISRTASRVMDPLGITTDGDGSSYAVFGAEVEVFTDVGDSQLVDGLGPGPHWAAFVPGESELVVGTGTGALHVVELPAGTTRRVITADDLDTQGRSFTSIAPSPEGRRLAVALRGNDDTAIRIVDLEDGSVSRAEGHTAEVDAVVWGPSGDVVYSGSDDRTIIEWSVPDLSPRRLDNHTDRVTGLAVVEPADVLLSSSQDGTVRLWDLASTDRAPTAIGLGGPLRWRGSVVDTLAAAGPGRAVSLESNTLVWWTVDIDGWVELACSIAGRSLTEAEEISYLADGVATTSCEGAAADVALLQR